MENAFGKFQGLPPFPKKMIFYSLTKFAFSSLLLIFSSSEGSI